jgi:hypothetical protein
MCQNVLNELLFIYVSPVVSSNTEGGIIYIGGAYLFVLSSCDFYNISVKQGGFLYISNTSPVNISNSNFTNGTASAGYGGAVCDDKIYVIYFYIFRYFLVMMFLLP